MQLDLLLVFLYLSFQGFQYLMTDSNFKFEFKDSRHNIANSKAQKNSMYTNLNVNGKQEAAW